MCVLLDLVARTGVIHHSVVSISSAENSAKEMEKKKTQFLSLLLLLFFFSCSEKETKERVKKKREGRTLLPSRPVGKTANTEPPGMMNDPRAPALARTNGLINYQRDWSLPMPPFRYFLFFFFAAFSLKKKFRRDIFIFPRRRRRSRPAVIGWSVLSYRQRALTYWTRPSFGPLRAGSFNR